MTKIYLAGSCHINNRALLQTITKTLRDNNFEVYAPYELKIPNAWDYTQEAWARQVFDEDTKAIDAADIVIVISPGRYGSAGTNWEQGYAYAKGKKVVVFQYTKGDTSLMTYAGSFIFINTNEDDLVTDILSVLLQGKSQSLCFTTLT